ncbi:glycosyltransferase family 4 protein [Alicyclobacillus sp. SO9]|uniref:glycosyltransferase n=1 Tax=Alicyclobacillus sp. SO9 TaxID=2665646 RepID=UPI0018E892C4|nr:glycosyltransferase family 4 protein [Alicyclobacillus sp. SO9]QQE80318.1 glycosyltransferase family 4 protein [Alicyclobacillus sp. SO9]
MRVFQGPTEIAGQMGIISKVLNKLGVHAAAYNTFHSYLGYRDGLYNVDRFELQWMMKNIISYFDLFHFHYADTLCENYCDLAEIHRVGKSVLMHHWGNDVRIHELAAQNNPYVYTGDSPPSDVVHKHLSELSQYITDAVVQDYEVYPYVAPYYKRVHVVPIALDVGAVTPRFPSLTASKPLVVHAPTNPLFKGTVHVEQAIERLYKEGVQFRYKRIEKMANKDAVRLYQEADIVVDQVLCGSYGLLAVESMSLGKPVIGYIREDLKEAFPEVPPIVSANPDSLFEVLRTVIQNPELRLVHGKKGREYALRYHSAETVVKQLLRIYQRLDEKFDEKLDEER